MNRGRWVRAGAAALLWAAAGGAGAAEDTETAIRAGVHASYTDGAGHRWCVTVVTVAAGPGGEAWAWFTLNDNPSRVEHTRVVDLKPGCAQQKT
ncbi:MAG TPA: hypothetical protein VJ598_09115 [Albitalea sp.]|nr:hypothetical protein [Albitalea sp.]